MNSHDANIINNSNGINYNYNHNKQTNKTAQWIGKEKEGTTNANRRRGTSNSREGETKGRSKREEKTFLGFTPSSSDRHRAISPSK